MKNKAVWIIGMIIGLVLINIIIINFYLENREKEYFEESCWYIMDKYPNICDGMYEKARANNLTKEEWEICPCKDRGGVPLFFSRDKFFEGDKDYVGEGCIYHKECEKQEIRGLYYYDGEYDKEDIQNVNVNLDGGSVIRVGNNTLLIVHIKNTNKRTDIMIENVKISNANNEIIKESIINQEIKPIRKEINKINNIMSFQINGKEESFFSGVNYIWKILLIQRIAQKLEAGSFRPESYKLDIRNFSSSPTPKIGEIVNIFVEVEFSHDSKTFVAKRSHSVLISEPLPSPPHD